jgi:hypothetical protein
LARLSTESFDAIKTPDPGALPPIDFDELWHLTVNINRLNRILIMDFEAPD